MPPSEQTNGVASINGAQEEKCGNDIKCHDDFGQFGGIPMNMLAHEEHRNVGRQQACKPIACKLL